MKGLPELLERFGVRVEKLLARHGLKPKALTARNHFIPYETYAAVLHDSAEACAAPHFGLLLSRASAHDPSAAGMLGMLLKRCGTVREAADALLRYYHSLSEGASYKLLIKGRTAFLMRQGLVPGLRHDRILQDLSLADFEMMLRQAGDPAWRATRIHFTYERPGDLKPYNTILGCPVVFGAPMQAIEFSTRKLDERIATSDPVLERLLKGVLAGAPRHSTRGFTTVVSEAIETLLPTGICCANGIADIFGMHSRTLHRRLKAEHSTFERLLDDQRRVRAESCLRTTSISLADISSALGYGEPAVFTRAFRRWHGVTPSAWREKNQRAAR